MPAGYCTGISYPANGTILTPKRPITAPSVVAPERFPRTTAQATARAYSFGERPVVITRPLLSRAPFRPRSFCLRVSGAGAPSAPRNPIRAGGATSPAGVHTALLG